MKKEMKYEEPFEQLQTIVRKMENDEFSIDEIAVQLKTAQRLIKFCKDKLTKTEQEILQIQTDQENSFLCSDVTKQFVLCQNLPFFQ